MKTGLELVAKELQSIWGLSVELGEPMRVFGAVEYAGGNRPLESTAVELKAGGASIYLPCPAIVTQDSDAAIFLHCGQPLVMPVVRLCQDIDTEVTVEYLTLGLWLLDALTVWKFAAANQPLPDNGSEKWPVVHTVRQKLRDSQLPITQQLHIVARLIRYALFGIDESNRYSMAKSAGIALPARSRWLRSFADGDLAQACAQRLVLTARLQESKNGVLVPTASAYAKRFRIAPASENDFGIDPVHTPEGEGIRLVGRLGCDVSIRNRKLATPDTCALALSPSTQQIPFAGHNDPRRLLMAANMQVQAINLDTPETPAVYRDLKDKSVFPPGVNLRTAYIAWQGFNHEDAWVISESAASKLGSHQQWVQTIAIPTIENSAEILVEKGVNVERGDRLVNRSICPAMLSASLDIWKEIASFDDHVLLDPEPEELATKSGEVVAIETVDFLGDNPDDRIVPIELCGRYRQLVRITLCRSLPLRLGDKLANRHGHKGIVGAIVADEDMPRHREQPLEALIDPISVMNRSNWGQVFETVLGGETAETQLRCCAGVSASAEQQETVRLKCQQNIAPPISGKWLTKPVTAIAGTQFVMRLPHIAADKLSLASNGFGNGKRPQRFGEMDSWALWAHGGTRALADQNIQPTSITRQFTRLLFAAGYRAKVDGQQFTVKRIALSDNPPLDVTRLSVAKSKLSEAISEVVEFDSPSAAAILIDPPLTGVRQACSRKQKNNNDSEKSEETTAIAWLPLVPLRDRLPHRMPSGFEVEHDLTIALRKIAKLAFYRQTGRTAPARKGTTFDVDKELRFAVEAYLELAYGIAVGLKATGELSSKASFLRRKLMGRPMRPSVRATAAPAGSLGLGVDEVGISLEMARALVNDHTASEGLLKSILMERTFWLKRDPVLHRYGLLQVSARLSEGDVIRLPASILSPLGADFDGDTIAMYSSLPGEPGDLATCRPSHLAWDNSLKRAMFVPGKQFRFGLGLLSQHPERLSALQRELAAVGAPPWENATNDPAHAFDSWVQQTHGSKTGDKPWSILERHAIAALALNPGMDLGLLSPESLASLSMVKWSAAKRDVFDSSQAESWDALCRVLSGESLSFYLDSANEAFDPIATVMIVAKESVGKFGGALRRLLYSSKQLRPGIVQSAQTLTEQATQRALSVKAGKRPLHFPPFNRRLNALINGNPLELSGKKGDEDVEELLTKLTEVYEHLRKGMTSNSDDSEMEPWLGWLRSPHRLFDLTRHHGLSLPLDDIRIRSWFCASDHEVPQ